MASNVKHHLYFFLKQFSNYREEIQLNMENLYLLWNSAYWISNDNWKQEKI